MFEATIAILESHFSDEGCQEELEEAISILEKESGWEVVAKGEVLHINDKFYLGYKIKNRIEELEALEECFYKKLPEGKNVEIAFSEVSK